MFVCGLFGPMPCGAVAKGAGAAAIPAGAKGVHITQKVVIVVVAIVVALVVSRVVIEKR